MEKRVNFEVIIIGGSYAGLSAAMSLGRSLRAVLVIDSGWPCNLQTPHSQNFLTHDGHTPGQIAAEARRQLMKYDTIKFHHGLAVGASKTDQGFTVITQTGEIFSGQKLIFATGIKDVMPDIPGFSECWGITVIHCPYCHGYEFRNAKTAILANGAKAYHLASLINNLTDDLTLLTNGKVEFDFPAAEKLRANGISIIEKEVAEIVHEDGYVKEVVFMDGSREAFIAVYAALPFEQHSDIPAALGCDFTEHGYIYVDTMQKTTVEGVFACGDNAAMMRSVANAISSGNVTGAIVNKELVDEHF
ncbi:NAD(P)/FAD-dependent oxidoreductase [Sphingobacterium gobiense]|uniref:Pyridine nucleotide-disulfide oxidoreductase n=1 Tax=Sphingobacterium gobiense TaxID=1382456 RepID=A0A2S9JUD0_9SPHI|nr:NAD(P)/FAD-dependent oxidoreductase [Sphingobacterium gobiense]PRD56873.1 pyridine nucleotide-disulfide oxidoreductase [Sphingobacterium gobiense]